MSSRLGGEMETRERQVSATLIELADTLVSDYELFEFLDLLLKRSMMVVGAAAGGVMLQGEKDLEPLASSGEEMLTLGLFELQRGEGPCIDCFRSGEQVVHSDLAAPSPWPRFAPAAIERGYRSTLAIPLRLRGEVIGVLNLHRAEPGTVARADAEVVQAFADMATIGILHERALRASRELAEQLTGALSSRIAIEQAKGMLAERGQITMGDAFFMLRRHARNHNLRLSAVASDVVSGALGIAAVLAHRPPRRPGPRPG